jgi:hypothetical protein
MENIMFSKILFSQSGRASGLVDNIDILYKEIDKFVDNYEAIALSTNLESPVSYYEDYFLKNSMNVNPWGSIEAMITHAVSNKYQVPCAHSPLMSEEGYNLFSFCGIVDPRKAPESESIADMYCCLKGLQKSPRIVAPEQGINSSNIGCLVIPHGCMSLPILSAFSQSIPVITVKENANVMKNRYSDYHFPNKILYEVDNYWEALAICQAIKSGIDPHTVRRPIAATKIV